MNKFILKQEYVPSIFRTSENREWQIFSAWHYLNKILLYTIVRYYLCMTVFYHYNKYFDLFILPFGQQMCDIRRKNANIFWGSSYFQRYAIVFIIVRFVWFWNIKSQIIFNP